MWHLLMHQSLVPKIDLLTQRLHFWRYGLQAPWPSTPTPGDFTSCYTLQLFCLFPQAKPNAQYITSDTACLQAAPAHSWPEELVWLSRAWKNHIGLTSGGSAPHPDAPLWQQWMKIKQTGHGIRWRGHKSPGFLRNCPSLFAFFVCLLNASFLMFDLKEQLEKSHLGLGAWLTQTGNSSCWQQKAFPETSVFFSIL